MTKIMPVSTLELIIPPGQNKNDLKTIKTATLTNQEPVRQPANRSNEQNQRNTNKPRNQNQPQTSCSTPHLFGRVRHENRAGIYARAHLSTRSLKKEKKKRVNTTHYYAQYATKLESLVLIVNPFRAPEPLPILSPSNFVPQNGFQL